MLTLLLVILYTVHGHYGDVLDLFGFPGYGHYDDPERLKHHAFPASEAIVSPINVSNDRNNKADNVSTGNVTASVDDGLYSESESDGGDLFIESDSDSDAENNNDNEGDGIDYNIDTIGVIDYIDGNISYGITHGARHGYNNGNTNDDTEAVHRNGIGNTFDYGNNVSINDSLVGIFLETEDVDDIVVVDTVNIFRDIYNRTGDVYENEDIYNRNGDIYENGDNICDIDMAFTDPFSDIYHRTNHAE